jgi:hypothetical protein
MRYVILLLLFHRNRVMLHYIHTLPVLFSLQNNTASNPAVYKYEIKYLSDIWTCLSLQQRSLYSCFNQSRGHIAWIQAIQNFILVSFYTTDTWHDGKEVWMHQWQPLLSRRWNPSLEEEIHIKWMQSSLQQTQNL